MRDERSSRISDSLVCTTRPRVHMCDDQYPTSINIWLHFIEKSADAPAPEVALQPSLAVSLRLSKSP